MCKINAFLCGILLAASGASAAGSLNPGTPAIPLNIAFDKGCRLAMVAVRYEPSHDAVSDVWGIQTRDTTGVKHLFAQLPAITQIFTIASSPILVNPGDVVDVKVYADSNVAGVLGPKVSLVCTGPRASRQNLLSRLYRLYNIPYERVLYATAFSGIAGLIDSLQREGDKLLAEAPAQGAANVALIRGYHRLLVMRIKALFYLTCYGKVSFPDSTGTWILRGQDIRAGWMDALGNDEWLTAYGTDWEMGRALAKYPGLDPKKRLELKGDGSYTERVTDLLQASANERLKCEIIKTYINWTKDAGITPEIKSVVDKCQTYLHDPATLQRIDSVMRVYAATVKGQTAFDFEAYDKNGKLVHLSDFKGKVVAMDFWATWCATCVKMLPYFEKIADKYKDNPDIVFLSLADEGAEDGIRWHNYLKSHNMEDGMNLRLSSTDGYDFKVMKSFGYTGVPKYALIDREGKIIEAFLPLPDRSEYEAAVKAALATPK